MNTFINDLWANLQGYYNDLVALMPKLILAVLAFSILLFIANRIKNIVNNKLGERMDDPLLARFLSRVAKIAIVLLALMLVMKIVGLADIAAGLITGAGVGAIVIGFAFKDIGENFLSGIMLAFDRPFRVGDTVELDGHKGKVVTLNMRTTQIKTFDGKDIYIPNASVIKNPVINYTIDGFMRQEFNIGLDYGSDYDKAIDVIAKTMEKINGIMTGERGPSVSIGDLNSSSLNITVQYWLDTFDTKFPAKNIRTHAVNKCLEELNKAGFYLPGDVIELKNYNDNEIKTGIKTETEKTKVA